MTRAASTSPTLFGVETEYACVPVMPADAIDPVVSVPDQLMELARRTLVHLPDRRSPGMFLGNGGRFYIDCGSHPEYATPECDNPWDVVRHVLAGDRILASLASDVESGEVSVGEVAMFKNNVDLSGSGATWGCHESYLHRVTPDDLAPQIIPHLVSRVIYTGAGGFHPLSSGLEFSVSPRVAHIRRTTSSDSTSNRGIFHTKDEPLARGFHRLHVLCGESVCSHLAAWLKVGTTALIVALVDAGIRPGEGSSLRTPLKAFRTFAADHTCSAEVGLTNGDAVTAIEIQETYLTLAEANLRQSFMPSWAPDVCREWRAMLNRLADAPSSVDRTLDWAIKWSMYDERIRRQLLTWERIGRWHPIIARLSAALERADFPALDVRVEVLLGEESPIPKDVERLTKSIRALDLEWSELVRIDALRRELYELETRFSQLGERGIFASLDRAGVLSHHVAGVDQIEKATSHAPDTGRAHTRGAAVQRLSGKTGWSCDWTGVFDHSEGVRVLDLSDPFKRRGLQAIDRLLRVPRIEPTTPPRSTPPADHELTSFMQFLLNRD